MKSGFLSPFVAAERGYIDEVIMPHSTRSASRAALPCSGARRCKRAWRKHDNLPL